MAEVKHTPGPWRISTDNATVGPEGGFAPFGACGCCDSPWMSADDDQTALADARLIAAAPDLFEALEAVLNTSGARKSGYDAFEYSKAVALAENALSKATTQQEGR